MRTRFIALMFFLAACSRSQTDPPTKADPPKADPPRVENLTVSLTLFLEGELSECHNVVTTPAKWAELQTKLPKELVARAQPCEEVFKGRQALATCAAKDGLEFVYPFEKVYESDARAEQCMKSGGTWKELISRESPQFRMLRAQHNARNLARR